MRIDVYIYICSNTPLFVFYMLYIWNKQTINIPGKPNRLSPLEQTFAAQSLVASHLDSPWHHCWSGFLFPTIDT